MPAFVKSILSWKVLLTFHESGQIIATSHDLTLNGGLVREISYFREI